MISALEWIAVGVLALTLLYRWLMRIARRPEKDYDRGPGEHD
jgi:hypothetical protein